MGDNLKPKKCKENNKHHSIAIIWQLVTKLGWNLGIFMLAMNTFHHTMSFSSVQFSHSGVSDSWRPHELQHTRPPCSSPTPRVHPLTSIESVMLSSHLILCHPLLLLPPIPPSIRVFSNESTLRIRWLKYWSFSFSISPSNEHLDWSPLKWTGWISLQSKGLPRVFSNTAIQKHQFFGAQLSSQSKSHIHSWPLEKP